MRLRKHKRSKKGKLFRKILVFILIFIVAGYIFIYRPAKKVQADMNKLQKSAQSVKTALSSNDIEAIKKELVYVKKEFKILQDDSSALYWLRFTPFLGVYMSDYKNSLEAGSELLEATSLAVDSIEPYADLIGFKKGESFIDKSAEDRLATAVLTLDKLTGDVDKISAHVDKARKKIHTIDTDRYPNSLFGLSIRPRLSSIIEQFNTASTLFVDAKPFVKKLPDILGSKEEKTYIVLFMNDKELRPSGGFLTAYAIFKVNQGKFKVVLSEDIYSLDDSISFHPSAPKEILSYHKGVYKYYIRDSNLSPDYRKSVELFEEMYAKSSKKVEYDGIVAVDTYVLVDALKILGDTEVRGLRFTSNEDKRCDCPGVIYELLDQIDRPVGHFRENRKGILGDLLYALMQKALGFSPSQYWGPLSQMMIRDLQEKHVLVYLTDASVQKSIESLNFAGRINKADSDYLHINNSNFAGAKSNLFIKNSVVSKTIIQKDGSVERELKLEYRNPYPHSNCNLEAGELCINATLRNWLRIYVPKGSKLISFNGSETNTKTYIDLDKTVFEGFMRVYPKGKTTVIVKYELPFTVKNKKDYSLSVQKQPGTQDHNYTIQIDEDTVFEDSLNSDTQYKRN